MSKKKTVFLIAGLALAIAAMLTVYFVMRPGTVGGAKELTVTVEHLNGENRTLTLRTDTEYLRDALEEIDLIGGTEDQYGLYLLTVDGETADESKQQWWGYTVNGEFALYGVDDQPIADGDVIVLTLTEGW